MSFKKLPGVLSFQRCVVVSDGLFYNEFDNGTEKKPLYIMRHGIRGTQNVNNGSKKGQAAAGSAGREVSNIQVTDSAKLEKGASLGVDFGFRALPISQALFSCAASKGETSEDIKAFKDAFDGFIERAVDDDSKPLYKLGLRYARNIANGRFLWRNRTIAEKIKISVTFSDKRTDKPVEFNAFDVPFNDFDAEYSDGEKAIAEAIAEGWSSEDLQNAVSLSVKACVDLDVDGPVEVFPSQNYLNGKDKGFARSLYCVGTAPSSLSIENGVSFTGQAALRDQKIGNALRTIDTWYKDFSDRKLPIAVEPKGANLGAQEFFREDKAQSGFELMKRVDELDPASDEAIFLLACIIRGGVYSEGSKEE
jgi:CRISPR-associated protein Csy3